MMMMTKMKTLMKSLKIIEDEDEDDEDVDVDVDVDEDEDVEERGMMAKKMESAVKEKSSAAT